MRTCKASNVVVGPADVAGLAPGGYVRISFEESGIGIPKDILPHIFDPFYTTKTKGHGLGLATCHSIVTRHDGCIEAESQETRPHQQGLDDEAR